MLFIGEVSRKGRRKYNGTLSIAFPVGSSCFLLTDSMGACSSASNWLQDVHEEVGFFRGAVHVCCHNKSMDNVMFIGITTVQKYVEDVEFHSN